MVSLAHSFPKLRFVVQDLPEVEEAFRTNVPSELASKRISFRSHDIFTQQTTPADVYFLKRILHDWPDKYAAEILRNLLPSLKPGGRIVLAEMVPPPTHDAQGRPLLPLPMRRQFSALDLQMLASFNSVERNLDGWSALAKRADPRLRVANVASQPGAPLSLIEIVYDG